MNQARRISSATQHFRNSQDAKDLFPLATVFDSGPASPTLARASETVLHRCNVQFPRWRVGRYSGGASRDFRLLYKILYQEVGTFK